MPLASTVLLVLVGHAAWSWRIAAACVLIIGGAIVAGGDRGRLPAHDR